MMIDDKQDDDMINKNQEDQNTQNENNTQEKEPSINKTSAIDYSMRNVDEILYNDNTHIIKVPVYDTDGKPMMVITISQDVTETKEKEKEVM